MLQERPCEAVVACHYMALSQYLAILAARSSLVEALQNDKRSLRLSEINRWISKLLQNVLPLETETERNGRQLLVLVASHMIRTVRLTCYHRVGRWAARSCSWSKDEFLQGPGLLRKLVSASIGNVVLGFEVVGKFIYRVVMVLVVETVLKADVVLRKQSKQACGCNA